MAVALHPPLAHLLFGASVVRMALPVAHAMVRNACLPSVVPDIEVKVCSSALRNSRNLPLSCGFHGSPVSAWLWQNIQGRNGTSYRYFPQPIRLYLLTVSDNGSS